MNAVTGPPCRRWTGFSLHSNSTLVNRAFPDRDIGEVIMTGVVGEIVFTSRYRKEDREASAEAKQFGRRSSSIIVN